MTVWILSTLDLATLNLLDTSKVSLATRSANLTFDAISIAHHSRVTPAINEDNFLLPFLAGSHPGIVVPVISHDEFRGFNWSSQKRVIKSSKGLKIYHNYTQVDDEDGARQNRFTVYEFLKNPEHIIHRRGFTVNFDVTAEEIKAMRDKNAPDDERDFRKVTWKWTNPSTDCPVVIEMCYEDQESLDRLQSPVTAAIDIWHHALGDKQGVIFTIIPNKLCPGPGTPNWNEDRVILRFIPGEQGASSTGYLPRYDSHGKHFVEFDPHTYPSDPLANAGMAHELGTFRSFLSSLDMANKVLGHTLGLFHEHQRYDAPDSIDYHCSRLRGYDQAKKFYLDEDWGEEDEFDEFACTDQSNAGTLLADLGGHDWIGDQFAPYKNEGEMDQTEILIDYKKVGAFDFKSIMLYGSFADAANPDEPVLTKKGQDKAGTWDPNLVPSNQDIAAVKQMYPDIEPPESKQ